MTSAIVLVLLMASVMLVAISPIQPVGAQLSTVQPYVGPLKAGDTPNATEYDGTTRAALSFRPTTIGVGQSLLVNLWITPAGPSNDVFVPEGGYVITITKPDGKQDVIKIRSEPATFANYFEYVPDQVGTWTLQFSFIGAFFPAGQYYNGVIVTNSSGSHYSVSTYYKPSSTPVQNLTVQQDMVFSWPLTLPTDYWYRPASMNNRGWWPILGAWPGTGYVGYNDPNWDTLYPDTTKQYNSVASFTPYVQAPNTAHVLWKQLGALAGLIGGPAKQYGQTGSPGTPSVIYAGRCYQTMTVPINGVPTSCAVCYDLRTGEQYYAIPTASPSNGMTPSYVAYVNPVPNTATIAGEEIGSSTWSVELLSISGSRLYKINAFTGALSGNFSIAPLSGGTFHNQIGGYVLNVQDLGAAAANATGGRYRLINWTTRGTLANLTITGAGAGTRIVSNTSYARSSLPSYLDFENDIGADTPSTRSRGPFADERWFMRTEFYRLSTGALLYNLTTNEFDTQYQDIIYHPSPTMIDHGKIATWAAGGYYVIFDGLKGTWFRSEKTDYPWSLTGGFGAYAIASAYGMVYRFAYNYVYAFNWTDGKMVWKYSAPTYAPFESPYEDANGTEVYSFNGGCTIVDGKMYIVNTEHTPTYPLTRGWGLHCINITDGSLLWKLDNPITPGAFADGYEVAANSWDGYMYVIGKGQSATTVTALPRVIANGAGVGIEGTVLDQSPAQAGTPCVSKDSMSQQMEYLHLSQPIGGIWNNVTVLGVPVTLTAIDENGTAYGLGTATSNGYSGVYSLAWTPPAEGKYEIIATFAGDDSYGSSMSTTAVTVGPAPAPITFPEQKTVEVPDYTMAIIAAVIVMIIALAIATVLILRKHP